MPHECTNCGRTFADGSKEMLSGCPDCGGNKFQFRPAGSSPSKPSPDETEPSASSEPGGASDSGGAVGRAASTVREWVGTREGAETAAEGKPSAGGEPREGSSTDQSASGRSTAERSRTTSETDATDATDSGEDRAQASARSDIVTEDELPDRPAAEDAGTVADTPDGSQPSLEELREELNSQFESIKVVEPGQYELNLMELYERDEYIIALKENGRYVIQVPDSWSGSTDA